MSVKIQETQERLKELGYYASEELAKLMTLFEMSGKRDKKNISTMLLQGDSGAGKTFLAEVFAKMIGAEQKFVQCFPRMGAENFQYDVNIEGVIKQDAEKSIKPGILMQAIQASHNGPVVLIIDELDKSRPEVDSFLLDFLENGRLTTGTETFEKGEFPIYVFITSNNKREIDEALLNRSRRVDVHRPEKEMFLEILGLPSNHYIGIVYDQFPNFSIRQAREYIEDLKILGVEFDETSLAQYIDIDKFNIRTLEALKALEALEKKGVEVDFPNLEICQINLTKVNPNAVPLWIDLLQQSDENFQFESKREGYYDDNVSIYVNIINTRQLEVLGKYGLDEVPYKGWFIHEMSDEEMKSEDICWADNEDEKDGTRFGIKMLGDKMYKIAINKGVTFVCLDSSEGYTLKHFLGQEVENDYNPNGAGDHDDYDDDDHDDYDEY